MTATVDLVTGHIVASLPHQNHYLVNTEAGIVTAVAVESGSGRRGGHVGGGTYMPGAEVLVAISREARDSSQRIGYPHLIIGAFSPYPVHAGTEFQLQEVVPGSLSDALNNEAYARLLENEVVPILNQNRGHKRPLDSMPGDFALSTSMGGVILLSEFMARIGSGPGSFLSFCQDTGLLETMAGNQYHDTGSFLRELYNRLAPLGIERDAWSIQEALGGFPAAFRANTDDTDPTLLVPLVNNQNGFFRREVFRGGSVEGAWEVQRTPAPGVVPNQYTARTDIGMISEMRRMDGIYRLRAAREIKFEKTPLIITPVQTAPLRGTDPVQVENPAEPTGTALSEDEISRLRPLIHDELATQQEQELFFQGMQQEEGIWYFPTKDDIDQALFLDEAGDEELPVLQENQQEYTTDDLTTADIEAVPGQVVRIFKNSSVFLMADDGGVIIGDGYGGEIRMNRGKVTIASAGDMEFLPGRDLVEMVPGNRLSRVGDRVEIASTRGSVALKAQQNMQLVSGGDEGGITTIENRSPATALSEIQQQALEQGHALGSGVLLKSQFSGIGLLGSHIYGGGYTRGKKSTTGVNAKDNRCDIMLDSGAGNMLLTGASGAMSFRNTLSMTMLEKVTGIYIQNNAILEVSSGTHFMVSPSVVFDKGEGTVEKPVLEPGGVNRKAQVNMPTQLPSVSMQGNLAVRGVIGSKSSIVSEDAVRANQGCNPDPVRSAPFLEVTMAAEGNGSVNGIASNASVITRTVMETMVANGIATEYGQKITEFAFPITNSAAYRAQNYELLAPKWQNLLVTGARTWVENVVAHAILGDTYPYPGKDAFTGDRKRVVVKDPGNDAGVSKVTLDEYKANLPK